ncbi:hypothetical protein [Croceicoccus sp. BE223]|uniref:hypothetical protein n=1 Tax=Croceicoccus sp. BE223 TaxID=2817716 RepID=UPI0028584AC7|nr:hypothetical protein [Croceicoccus sp. BE223]MDR7101387.1 hypothetical protein [Croceicoccus sp. BE223]
MTKRDWIAAALIAGFAFLIRSATFGNPTLEPDESFYMLVGIKMHDGLLPYIDIYDRKPFGLFLIYYLIAFISHDPAAYQVVATLFAATTGFVIYAFSRSAGGIAAGCLYLAGLALLFGNGGQAPVFYNLLVAAAGWLIFFNRKVGLAMILCGAAITIKHSAVFEAIFLGLYAMRNRPLRDAVKFVALGCFPFALTALPFLSHFDRFWACVFLAPIDNEAKSAVLIAKRLIEAFPVVFAGLAGLALSRHRLFLSGWLLATALSFVAVPNFYPHYLLPMLVPLSIASARLGFGTIPFVLLAVWMHWPFDFERTKQARAEFARLDKALSNYPGRLAVNTGPVLLYRNRSMPYDVWHPQGDVIVDRCDRADFLYMMRQSAIGVCIFANAPPAADAVSP